jgi:hypothetical protein
MPTELTEIEMSYGRKNAGLGGGTVAPDTLAPAIMHKPQYVERLAEHSAQRVELVVDFAVRPACRDGDGARYAIAGLALEAGGCSAPVIVDEALEGGV